MKKYLVILAAVMGFSSAAHAGLYLEPYVGYFSGKFKIDTFNIDEAAKGVVYGGKVGYGMLGFAAGADYMAGSVKAETTPEETVKPTNLGAFVQFSVPMLFKVSGSYFFSSKVAGDDFDLTGGNGMKLGIGFTMLPLVSINVDYISIKQKKFEQGGLSFDADSSITGIMVGASIPLDL